MGLSSCLFCSSFILNNGLRSTACLSDMNVDVYKLNEIQDFLIQDFIFGGEGEENFWGCDHAVCYARCPPRGVLGGIALPQYWSTTCVQSNMYYVP